jgi:hypothetical protein
MTTITILLKAAGAVPALVVLWYCICSLNEMTPDTPHSQRLAVILLAGGVFTALISMVEGRTPDEVDLLLLAGLMVLVRSNCRRGVCPCVKLPSWPDRRKEPR